MADKKQKPAFTHMRWSEADDKLLRELIQRGADGTTISKTLGRTRSSIFNRKFVLGIDQAMKKTKKGQTNDLTYGSKVRTAKEHPEQLPATHGGVEKLHTKLSDRCEVTHEGKARPN